MEPNRLDALVEKYWDGETTVEEEKELKHFFSTCDLSQLSEPMQEVAQLFQYYMAQEQQPVLSTTFDEKLLDQLKTRPFTQVERRSSVFFNLLKLAACLVLVVSAVWIFRNQQQARNVPPGLTELDTYEDPQQAYEETRKALLLVSAQLNRGKSYASEIRKINEAEEVVRQEQ
jgi:hypothetical protein